MNKLPLNELRIVRIELTPNPGSHVNNVHKVSSGWDLTKERFEEISEVWNREGE